jgi:hypothetical protein
VLFDLLQLLPEKPGDGALIIAMIGAVFGSVLWVAGVRVSRPLVTLVTVLLGASVGLMSPRWFNWNISGAGPAVGGAVVLGVSGFVLHRMWVGFGFGLILTMWGAFAMWLTMRSGQGFDWPSWSESSTACSYLHDTWNALPANIAKYLPYVAGVAMISATAAMILWPKLTTAMSWSAIGMTMFIGLTTGAIAMTHRDWLAKAPQQTWVQLSSLAGLWFIGTAIQWKLSPKQKTSALKPPSDKKRDD